MGKDCIKKNVKTGTKLRKKKEKGTYLQELLRVWQRTPLLRVTVKVTRAGVSNLCPKVLNLARHKISSGPKQLKIFDILRIVYNLSV